MKTEITIETQLGSVVAELGTINTLYTLGDCKNIDLEKVLKFGAGKKSSNVHLLSAAIQKVQYSVILAYRTMFRDSSRQTTFIDKLAALEDAHGVDVSGIQFKCPDCDTESASVDMGEFRPISEVTLVAADNFEWCEDRVICPNCARIRAQEDAAERHYESMMDDERIG